MSELGEVGNTLAGNDSPSSGISYDRSGYDRIAGQMFTGAVSNV